MAQAGRRDSAGSLYFVCGQEEGSTVVAFGQMFVNLKCIGKTNFLLKLNFESLVGF